MFAATISSQTAPEITSTSDSDFIIADGGNITVSVSNPGAATYTFQPVFGFVLTGTVANGPATYTHQAGGPTGDLTIRATSPGIAPLTKTLTVGDAGDNLATVSVNLGTTNADGTSRGASPRAATDLDEKDTSDLGTVIYIEIEALNSLGNPTNVAADPADMDISVFAVGGTVASGDTAGTGSNATANVATPGTNTSPFVVSRAVAAGAGSVEVFAVATIGTTSVRSESLTLMFTVVAGAPANVNIEDGAAVARNGASIALDDDAAAIDPAETATRATLPVSATDADGNKATLLADTAITATVKSPDGKDVAAENNIANVALTRYVLDADPNTSGNQSAIIVTLPEDTPVGEYTVEATLGTSKDTAKFVVTGPPASVSLTADPASGATEGTSITVTATVNDANGVAVADKTKVDFVLSRMATSPIVATGTSHMQVDTKDGVASVDYYALETGRAAVTAISGGVTAVISIDIGAAAPTEEPEAPAPDPVTTTVELSHLGAELSAGGSVTITADVKDQNGAAVPDGTMVTFTADGGGTMISPSSVATVDGMASAEFINLTDDIWVQAYSSPVRSDTLRVMVESEAEEAARLAAEQAEADRIAAEEEAQRLADEEAERQRMADEEAERQRMADEEAQRLADEEAERQRQEAERQAAEEAERQAQEERDAQILASIRAELAAAAAAQDAASAAQAAANAAEAAAAAETAADAQAAADMAKAYADKAQAAANSASDESETAGTDAAQASADAAAASAEAAQASADAAQASADETAEAEAAAQAEAERIAAEEAERQAEADRQQEIDDAIAAALEAERQRLADEEAQRQAAEEAARQAEADRIAAEEAAAEAERQAAEEEAARQAAEEAARRAMPASVSISSSPDDLADGTVVTVTISVTDHNDMPVADGTAVSVVLGGSLDLNAVTVGTGTINGAVTAVYIVDGDMGSATIVATAGAAVGTATLTIEPPAPVEEPAPTGIDCLSETSGFSTWTCEAGSSASAIFADLAARGATALHLWNGTAWVRYSVVDGALVPGSQDFAIAQYDTLYISN